METRFVAKQLGTGRGSTWRVYDRKRASFPYTTPELGTVAQDHDSEQDAQDECDRLAAIHGGFVRGKLAAAEAGAGSKKSKRSALEAGDSDAADMTETDDEQVLSVA